ncbi:phosphatidate cytidylyltransferase [Verrucomicrobiaceae bacterium 5K15]|uniref:Phosphatidate cytidylyltransferase n=1 Tax=Oceaniferula flava TaxID=2800421 RepID=A0AAE2VDJ7_9BACT|nr:phosphatidate cytidylyltransferase [Oceaniferula flavus]MBK1854699.1 phosphatidate cytidylyltransferase [Oceaniferula flavus]MBM1136005.1 phosphatidate cytidylyltransferase [Oceaniferula flavus]
MSSPSEAKKSKAQVFAARLFSTLILWALVTAVFVSDQAWAFLAVLSLLGLFSVREYFQMTRKGGMPSQPRWGLLVSSSYLIYVAVRLGMQGPAALDGLLETDIAFVMLIVTGGFMCQLRRSVDGKNTVTEVAITTLGFVYVAVLYSFLARLLFLPEPLADGARVPGAWLLLWLIAVTKFTDMGAYITGSLIGKHKMIPHISPGKTWQGFGGALIFSQLAGCGLYAIMPAELAILGGWGWVVLLSLVLSLLAVVGDLAESVLKRSIGVKDSGNTLPGIGGALDLIDSLCFTAPVLYFFLRWMPV